MIVLKLGGSVLTRKDEPETVDCAALERTARAVADVDDDLVVVHGGGSFGHHHADAHGVTPSEGTADATVARQIHDAMCRLNDAVVDELQAVGVPALPVHPLSAGYRDAGGDLSYPVGVVRALLGEGFLPVAHGDVVAHAGRGVTVLSGDELVATIARELDADRVGLCSTVPGVLDHEDRVIDRIDSFEAVADLLGGSETPDVTGGMAGKVQTLLNLEATASVFGPDSLEGFLAGESVGTTVEGSG